MSSDYRTDHRLGRLVRLRDPNAATPGAAGWLDGVTTAVDEELSDGGRRRCRKYLVCLLPRNFASSDEAIAHFCEMESQGRVIACINHPVDLADMERSGDVMYVDDLPHPALSPGWSEEDSRRDTLNAELLLTWGGLSAHQRYEVANPHAVARRNAEEQERRRLQVVAAVVDGLRSSPFYLVLPNAPSRRALDEMCLRAMAPVRSSLAALPGGGDVAVNASRTTVSMRGIAEASKAYEADVAIFLLELAFAKTWAQRTHGSVQAAREAARGGEEENAVAGAGAAAGAWMREATALSRFDRGVRDKIRNCLLG
jgi:hypothetical protein